jgi:hypothetical protein
MLAVESDADQRLSTFEISNKDPSNSMRTNGMKL